MQKDPPNNKFRSSSEELARKLHEAKTYIGHGLYDEARAIYNKLLQDFTDADFTATDPDYLKNKPKTIDSIQAKLKEIGRLENKQTQTQSTPGAAPSPESEDIESLFNKGLALKEIGSFERAMSCFWKTADAGYRELDSLEEIGDALIQKGQVNEGVEILRKIYREKEPGASQVTTILNKIAIAYERSFSQMNLAMEVYQELAFADSFAKQAGKTDQKPPGLLQKIRFQTITRHRWVFLCLSLMVAIGFMLFNPYVKIVDNVDHFTVENSPDAKFYNDFKDIFGSDEFFVIAFETDNLFTTEKLGMLRDITEELEAVEEIQEVTSLANVDDTIGDESFFEVRQFIDELPETPEAAKQLKASAISNSIYTDTLVSKDGNTTAIIVDAFESKDDIHYKTRLIEKIETILAKYKSSGIDFHLAGPTVINYTLSKYMNADMSVFVPVSYCLIAFFIWFFFRNVPLTIVALLNISLCVGATRGFMGLAGLTFNNVTSIVIPLVMALSLCDSVHIFSHMNKSIIDELPDKFEALAHVLRRVALPCFMTTLTTAIGFLTLSVSNIPAIREFAWAAAAGMGFEFFFSFFFLPPLLLFFSPEKIFQDYGTRGDLTQLLHRVGSYVERRYVGVALITVAVVVASFFYTGQVSVETNFIKFFKYDSPIQKSMVFVEEKLSGIITFDISLRADAEDAFKDPENLQVIEELQAFLITQKGIDKTLSFVDFIKDMNESFNNEKDQFFRIPDTREMVAQYLLLYDSEEIEDFVNNTFDHARISVRISEHSSLKQKEIIQKVQKHIDGMPLAGLDVRITGRAISAINIVDDLVRGQILSLALAGAIITALMVFVFRSASLALLSMLPNIFPIIINFGVMGLFKIPLDTGTALIAAVAIGIAVDDTIHFISEYQHQRNKGMPISNSLKSATLIKGRALLTSSIILTIGFGVTTLSRFVPIMHFGLLTALIMLTAVIGDIIVLPAILYFKKDKNLIPERTIVKT